jgi:hypothetical protein
MSPRPFEPRFMKLSVLTAALQQLTPRRARHESAVARAASSGGGEQVRAS